MHPIINIGGLQFTGYWLMAVLGLLVAALYLVATNFGRRLEFIAWRHLATIFFLAMFSVFAGGKLMGIAVNIPDIVKNWRYYRTDMNLFLQALTSGRAFYGGFLLGIALIWWYSRRNTLNTDTLCALLTPAVPLFMVLGRIGCFLGGCCYGIPVKWGIVFPEESLAPSGIPLFPSQLAEAAGQLALFIALAVLARRIKLKRLILPIYIGGYAVLRFVLEFWRGDAARGIWILSVSQWTSIILLCIAGLIAWRWTSKYSEVQE